MGIPIPRKDGCYIDTEPWWFRAGRITQSPSIFHQTLVMCVIDAMSIDSPVGRQSTYWHSLRSNITV